MSLFEIYLVSNDLRKARELFVKQEMDEHHNTNLASCTSVLAQDDRDGVAYMYSITVAATSVPRMSCCSACVFVILSGKQAHLAIRLSVGFLNLKLFNGSFT